MCMTAIRYARIKLKQITQLFFSVSNPCEEISGRGGKGMATTMRVKGMTCQHCVMSVKKALGKLEGIENVDVDLQRAEVRFDNTKGVASDLVKKAIEEAGYEVVTA